MLQNLSRIELTETRWIDYNATRDLLRGLERKSSIENLIRSGLENNLKRLVEFNVSVNSRGWEPLGSATCAMGADTLRSSSQDARVCVHFRLHVCSTCASSACSTVAPMHRARQWFPNFPFPSATLHPRRLFPIIPQLFPNTSIFRFLDSFENRVIVIRTTVEICVNFVDTLECLWTIFDAIRKRIRIENRNGKSLVNFSRIFPGRKCQCLKRTGRSQEGPCLGMWLRRVKR